MLVALVVATAVSFSSAQAQKPRKPLTKDDVIELLKGAVPSARVAQIARGRGIVFEMTRTTEKELREAGADEDLLRILRGLAPRSTSAPTRTAKPVEPPPSPEPPVLLIETTPGTTQVYVDDEPVGTTSSEGRLKLSRLAPGEHRVRLSLAGYRDYEQRVELRAGQTETVAVALETASAPEPARPEPAGGVTNSVEAPALGVNAAPFGGPHGERGAVITWVVSGSPAERAGLRVGNVILSVGGQNVASLEELQRAISSYRPGDTVDITFSASQAFDTPLLTTRAELVARSAVPVSAPPVPSATATNPLAAVLGGSSPVVSFTVAHDHGSAGSDYCVGILAVGNGMIQYRSSNGLHSFDFPLTTVKEAKKNGVYLVAIGGFHIRLKKGSNYNFVQLNSLGRFQPPDALLQTIEQAMGQR